MRLAEADSGTGPLHVSSDITGAAHPRKSVKCGVECQDHRRKCTTFNCRTLKPEREWQAAELSWESLSGCRHNFSSRKHCRTKTTRTSPQPFREAVKAEVAKLVGNAGSSGPSAMEWKHHRWMPQTRMGHGISCDRGAGDCAAPPAQESGGVQRQGAGGRGQCNHQGTRGPTAPTSELTALLAMCDVLQAAEVRLPVLIFLTASMHSTQSFSEKSLHSGYCCTDREGGTQPLRRGWWDMQGFQGLFGRTSCPSGAG